DVQPRGRKLSGCWRLCTSTCARTGSSLVRSSRTRGTPLNRPGRSTVPRPALPWGRVRPVAGLGPHVRKPRQGPQLSHRASRRLHQRRRTHHHSHRLGPRQRHRQPVAGQHKLHAPRCFPRTRHRHRTHHHGRFLALKPVHRAHTHRFQPGFRQRCPQRTHLHIKRGHHHNVAALQRPRRPPRLTPLPPPQLRDHLNHSPHLLRAVRAAPLVRHHLAVHARLHPGHATQPSRGVGTAPPRVGQVGHHRAPPRMHATGVGQKIAVGGVDNVGVPHPVFQRGPVRPRRVHPLHHVR